MFALWRTCQHYVTPGSLPDASSATLVGLLAAAADLPTIGRFQQFVAGETESSWASIGFVLDGSVKDRSAVQLEKYDRCRTGQRKFVNPSYPTLTPADHPQRTVDLDL